MARLPTARTVQIATPPGIFTDARGTFMETWRSGKGIPVMRCGLQSTSKKGVLRGFHFQRKNPRALLVRCIAGMIWDVSIDLRAGSPTLGRFETFRLGAAAGDSVFVPAGYAHAFYAMTDCTVVYECSEVFDPDSEDGLHWSAAAAAWEGIVQGDPILSEKDAAQPVKAEPIEV